jgi:hypothetical protein
MQINCEFDELGFDDAKNAIGSVRIGNDWKAE